MNNKINSYKLVLLGDTAVGKSCISVQFTTGQFFEFQEPTIGAAFLTSNLEVDNKNVKFEIWDTAGQERYRSLAPMYYRGAKFAVIVYDITSRDSFEGAKLWINELKRRGNKECITILVGNKVDLVNDRKVKKWEGVELSEQENILFIEVSAKENININEIFINLVKTLDKLLTEDNNNSIKDSDEVNTIVFSNKKRKKRNFC